ncbi:transposase [Actinomadura litoris]|uniref:Transposase n=1 Tax=Actinomadura litoris TaxID=2678616 RepID=A0A7K1KS94_9ACTN|nr:transposase [Actinomadura litoris]MUN35058.1 transposase [Actinomadura litoris]
MTGPPSPCCGTVRVGLGAGPAAIRRSLRVRGVAATISERLEQKAGRGRRGSRGGRPPAFDPTLYKRRDVVERCIGRLKQGRGIATRYDELVRDCRAAIVLVAAQHMIHRPRRGWSRSRGPGATPSFCANSTA